MRMMMTMIVTTQVRHENAHRNRWYYLISISPAGETVIYSRLCLRDCRFLSWLNKRHFFDGHHRLFFTCVTGMSQQDTKKNTNTRIPPNQPTECSEFKTCGINLREWKIFLSPFSVSGSGSVLLNKHILLYCTVAKVFVELPCLQQTRHQKSPGPQRPKIY